MVKGKMDMEKLFNFAHGALDMDKMKRLSDALEEDVTEEYFGVTAEQAQQALDYLGVSANDIYSEPENFIHPFHYIKGFTMIDIPSFIKEHMESFMTKQSIEMWTKRFDEYAEKGDWKSLIGMSDKRISLLRFLESYKDIPKNEVIDIFAEMYCRQEFGFYLIDENIVDYIYSNKENSLQWKERMAGLPAGEEIVIYRGTSRDVLGGYSWTTSVETAKFFANRYGYKGKIYKGTVRRGDILDYLAERGESEVLVNPKDISDVGVFEN